ncbi:hypothetical protein L7F22_046518 [Adiantum nelumboides]|nr:hypothetical protein [Adiantum nelumboides]
MRSRRQKKETLEFASLWKPTLALLLLLIISLQSVAIAIPSSSSSYEGTTLPLYHSSTLAQGSRGSHGSSIAAFESQKETTSTQPTTEDATELSGGIFTSMGVGNPVQNMALRVDTASAITWVQCVQEGQIDRSEDYPGREKMQPHFVTAASTTLKPLPCTQNPPNCPYGAACEADSLCHYNASYGDGKHSDGVLHTDRIRFGDDDPEGPALLLRDALIGCSNPNTTTVLADGVLALGAGPDSLPSKYNMAPFSYCVPPSFNYEGFLTLNTTLNISANATSVPFTHNPAHPSLYYLSLVHIGVGGSILPLPNTSFLVSSNGHGGTILDVGTPIAKFEATIHSALIDAFKPALANLTLVPGGANGYDTCFFHPTIDESDPDDIYLNTPTLDLPTIDLHFDNGSVLAVHDVNTLVHVGWNKTCLAFHAAAPGATSILGANLQQGFKITVDLPSNLIHFEENSC